MPLRLSDFGDLHPRGWRPPAGIYLPAGADPFFPCGAHSVALSGVPRKALRKLVTLCHGVRVNRHGARLQARQLKLYWRQDAQCVSIWRGLVAIVEMLTGPIQDLPDALPLFEPPATLPPIERELDPGWLELVRTQEFGLARVTSAVSRPWLVAQLALSWPDRQFIVFVPHSRRAAVQFYRAVRNWVPGAALTLGNRRRARRGGRAPVIVADLAGLAGHLANGVPWDVLIAPRAEHLLSPQFTGFLQLRHRFRIFGMVDVEDHWAPLTADRARCIYGFNVTVIPAHGRALREVRTNFVRYEGRGRLPRETMRTTTRTAAWLRRTVWTNRARNQFIAGLAQRAMQDGPASFELEGGYAANERRTVAVLVETCEHAHALSELLPDADCQSGSVRGATRPGNHAKAWRCLARQPCITIVTAASLAAYDYLPFDILIRADAGVGLAPIRRAQLEASAGAIPSPLLIVDLNDRNHPLLRRANSQREQAYRHAEWYRVGRSMLHARRLDFVLARRRGT